MFVLIEPDVHVQNCLRWNCLSYKVRNR